MTIIQKPKSHSPAIPLIGQGAAILALSFAAMSGWALRGKDGLLTSGTLRHACAAPEDEVQSDLQLARWLNGQDQNSGPIAAITLVTQPPVIASAMHPAPRPTLEAWTYLHHVPLASMPYADLMRNDGWNYDQNDGPAASERFSPACHAEAIAIAALERMIAQRGAMA
jgi:hypothetical protein